MAKEMKKIMVTGSVGQIGSELTMALREKYGNDNVIATGHRTKPKPELRDSGPFEFINVTQNVCLWVSLLFCELIPIPILFSSGSVIIGSRSAGQKRGSSVT